MGQKFTFRKKTVTTYEVVEEDTHSGLQTQRKMTPEQAFRRMTELKNEGFREVDLSNPFNESDIPVSGRYVYEKDF